MIRRHLPNQKSTFLVLCDLDDAVAAATAQTLELLGAEVVVVTAEELGLGGAGWFHLHSRKRIRTLIELADGRKLDSENTAVVLNRLRWAAAWPFPRKADREYALMEMFALLLSWLASLPATVVNPPSPCGLAGDERSLLEWLRLAAAAGLPVRRVALTTEGRSFHPTGMCPYVPALDAGQLLGEPLHPAVPTGSRPVVLAEAVEPRRRALVVGTAVFGAPTRHAEAGFRRLAAGADCPLLELEIAQRHVDGTWVVCGVDPFPADLEDAEVDALARLLVRAADRTGAP